MYCFDYKWKGNINGRYGWIDLESLFMCRKNKYKSLISLSTLSDPTPNVNNITSLNCQITEKKSIRTGLVSSANQTQNKINMIQDKYV